MSHEKDIDTIVKGLKVVKGTPDFLSLCMNVAQTIERTTPLPGPQKLALLQAVLRRVIVESSYSEGEKAKYTGMVETVVPIVIDAALFASKSPIVKSLWRRLVRFCTCNCVGKPKQRDLFAPIVFVRPV